MTDLLQDDDLKTEGEVAREPAKAWKNKWRVFVPHICATANDEPRPPGIYWSPETYPSREIAEQKARDYLAYDGEVRVKEHLGAFPVEGEGA